MKEKINCKSHKVQYITVKFQRKQDTNAPLWKNYIKALWECK